MSDLDPDTYDPTAPIASGFYLMFGIVVAVIGLLFFLMGHAQHAAGHLMEGAGLLAGAIGVGLLVTAFAVRRREDATNRP